MKRTLFIIGITSLLVAASCIQKPSVTPGPGPVVEPDDSTEVTPPAPPQPEEPKYQDVKLHSAFTEKFSAKTTDIFDFSYKEGDDLRYYPHFPSWNEKGTDLLMLRVDPKDPAGVAGCPRISTREHTFYGRYSVRMRLPDIKAVQANIGLNAVLAVEEQDEKNGFSNILMMWKMADPSYIYTSTSSDVSVASDKVKDPVSNYRPSNQYYLCGFDWHSDKVSFWIRSGEDKIIKEVTDVVPCFPSRFGFYIYNSKNNPVESNSNATQLPFYPYEFEFDYFSYEPFEDEINAWHEENFKN